MFLIMPMQKEIHIQFAQGIAKRQIFFRRFGLLFKGRKMRFELFQNVHDADQVFVCTLHTALRLILACTITADPCRLLKHGASILAVLAQDVIDAPLPDDGVALLTDTCIAKQIDDILQTAITTIELIFTIATAIDTSCDAHFVVGKGELLIGIVKREGHFAIVHGFFALGAIEDDIRHAIATKGFGALFAQYPTHGIADIAFPTAIRTHNASHILRKDDFRPFGKGFETVNFELGKPHAKTPYVL